MERRKFVQQCGKLALVLPSATLFLEACSTIYYAQVSQNKQFIVVPKSEFIKTKKSKTKARSFVLVEATQFGFPICLYQHQPNDFSAAIMECTHRSCELNIGGGMYTCPCHGSEFSLRGKVLQGPAEQDLKTLKTTSDNENIYIHLAS